MTTEEEMVGWHHRLNGHEFEQTPGDSEGQRSLAGYHPWGHESDMTQDGTTRKASPHPEDQSQVTDYETV